MARTLRLLTAAACAAACAGMAACATPAPYNPDDFGGARLAQISAICQSVMGLQPSERPQWGLHPGDLHLDPGVSHYQGCIASLSDSLQRAEAARAATLADRSCRSKGLAPSSAALAVCVLQSPGLPASAANTMPGAGPATARLTRVGSFLYASPREALHREQLACARLGLEPPGELFTGCVKSLRDTFFAIDNPVE